MGDSYIEYTYKPSEKTKEPRLRRMRMVKETDLYGRTWEQMIYETINTSVVNVSYDGLNRGCTRFTIFYK